MIFPCSCKCHCVTVVKMYCLLTIFRICVFNIGFNSCVRRYCWQNENGSGIKFCLQWFLCLQTIKKEIHHFKNRQQGSVAVNKNLIHNVLPLVTYEYYSESIYRTVNTHKQGDSPRLIISQVPSVLYPHIVRQAIRQNYFPLSSSKVPIIINRRLPANDKIIILHGILALLCRH